MQVARTVTAATTRRRRRSLEPEPSAMATPGRRGVHPASTLARLLHTDDSIARSVHRRGTMVERSAVSTFRPASLCPSCAGTEHILLSLLAVHTTRPRHTSGHCPLCAHRPTGPFPTALASPCTEPPRRNEETPGVRNHPDQTDGASGPALSNAPQTVLPAAAGYAGDVDMNIDPDDGDEDMG